MSQNQTAQHRKPKVQTLSCLLLYLAFAFAVAAPVLGGGVPVATDTLSIWGPQSVIAPQRVHNSVLADSALEYLPIQVFVRRSLAAGEWPLWNPDIYSGHPFQGNPQAQLYYPIAWLLWLLPLSTAFQMNVIIHLWLAGVGMYALARVLRISFAGSLVAGLAFAGSGQLYTALELPGVSNIYIWLPWVVAASELSWRRRSWQWAAAAGLLFGVLALSGNPQWFFYSGLLLAAWFGARLVAAAWDSWRSPAHPWQGLLKAQAVRALRSGAVLLWGPALAAVQVFPFLELMEHSTRNLSLERFIPYDPLNRTLRLLVPQMFGNSAGGVGEPLLFNNCWYIGLAPLALAAVALLARRTRLVFFLGAIGLVSLAVAAGVPFFDQAQRLPGFRAQLPERISYLFIFCAALLAGVGLDTLASLIRRRPRVAALVYIILAALAALLIFLLSNLHEATIEDRKLYNLQTSALWQAGLVAVALAACALISLGLRTRGWRYTQTALAAVLLIIISFDLLTYAPGYNTYVRPEALQFNAQVANVMRSDAGLWRMMTHDTTRETFPPNTALLYGLHDVQGYDALHITRYDDYWAAADDTSQGGNSYFGVASRPQNYSTAQADLLNVKYVTTLVPISFFGQTADREVLIRLGVASATTIAQTFLTPSRLNSIDVAAFVEGENDTNLSNPISLALHIRRNLTDTEDLTAQTLDLADFREPRWLRFSFPALDVRKGEPLVMVLESPSPGHSISLWSSKEDAYRDGDLYVDGQLQEGDLAFGARGELAGKLRRNYEEDVALYTNIQALPRAFVVGHAEVMTASDIPARIAEKGFDPRQVVLLEETPPAGFPDSGGDTTPPGTAEITSYRNLSVDITARMEKPGWLVLGDVNYPGWNVEVDGKAVPLYTAYYILRAVPLSEGTHHVRFYFLPGSVLLGGAISLVALIAALGTLLYAPITRRLGSRR